jgi:hypothetical protein
MSVWLSDLPEDMIKAKYSATLNIMKATLSRLGLRWKVAGQAESTKDEQY